MSRKYTSLLLTQTLSSKLVRGQGGRRERKPEQTSIQVQNEENE